MPREFTKQPSAVKDYDFDWSGWLRPTLGDTIATSSVVSSPAGLTLGAKTHTNADQTVKQFIAGGTVGVDYVVTCVITTAQGRVDEAEIRIHVRELV